MPTDSRGSSDSGNPFSGNPLFGMFNAVTEYMIDAAQRSVLYCDVLRQRGNAYLDQAEKEVPHVLDYQIEPVIDGRKLDRPVNYGLVRVVPPAGVQVDLTKRPFVVVDPRAGHGPGIGGFKADSEIGVALKAGHPCYFVGFTPDPMPGQTIEDIARAEAKFLEKVIELHPQAEGRPCVIGNCQAGWAVMMLAAIRPELFGPIIIAGSPLSYWAGVRGKNPMRYTGGITGGSWLAALASDLGGGKFDGAHLVQNFENQNPSNTYWSKQYNLYSRIDTEAPRYLDFERWWGGHVNLNAEEIQFIVDELFIGNNLATGRLQTSDGRVIDLRKIRSPIVVFCSQGDNITPPQQALGWILDLYDDVDDIRSHGQTIVYSIHESAGHLGIFVSGGVARKEHSEFSSNIDLIDVLPPGLYEAVFEAKADDASDLAVGEWIMRCEMRTLDDIRALGGNDAEDERRFATAARVSEINLTMYRAFAQPFVRAMVTSQTADIVKRMHPLRLQYEQMSNANPFMAWVEAAAKTARDNRAPAPKTNPLVEAQNNASEQIVKALDAWRDMAERMSESAFLSIYGSPALQAAVGIDPNDESRRRASKDPQHRQLVQQRITELKAKIPEGGLREAIVRALLYIGMPRGAVDERTFEAIRRIRQSKNMTPLPLVEFKKLVREQFFMLLIDSAGAIAAIPKLIASETSQRGHAVELIREVVRARGSLPPVAKERLQQIEDLFGASDLPTQGKSRRPDRPGAVSSEGMKS